MKNLRVPMPSGLLVAILLGSITAAWTPLHAAGVSDIGVTRQGQPTLATLPGESATLLPNGTWLLLGGTRDGVGVASAAVHDPGRDTTAGLAASLPEPRSGHSATVIPDGRVLIVGGVGTDNHVLPQVLAFDPRSQAFAPLAIEGLTPRTDHTATLLTDGRVLITGGVGEDGNLIREVQLIDTATWQIETIDAALDPPRFSHLASLMPESTVLLWGGFGENDQPLPSGSLYDPGMAQFFAVPPLDDQAVKAMLDRPGSPIITGGIPPSGAVDFPVDGRISVRFSTPMDMPTLNADSVVLYGPTGIVAALVIPAEGGRLVFVTPAQQLLPASQYTLFLNGPASASGERLAFSAISFRTAALGSGSGNTAPTRTTIRGASNLPTGASIEQHPAAALLDQSTATTSSASTPKDTATEDDEEWIPGPQHFRGNWRAHRALPVLARTSAPRAAEGVTALSGLVLRLNGKPLANVTLSIAGKTARTDADGYFLLSGVAAGKQTLAIDGTTANRSNATYGFFEAVVQIDTGRTTALPFTIWMPKLDTQHTIKIPSPTTEEVVLTTPRIPGFEAHIPAGVVIRDRAGKVVTEIGITPIPVDRTPFPQPWMDFPVYYTVQPGGAFLQGLDGTKVQSARLVYPNYTTQPPGQRASFWLYDPVDKGWYVYGEGAVSADGASVLPDAGVGLYEFTGGGYSVGPTPPPDGPNPCNSCNCTPGSGPADGSCGANNPEGGGGDAGTNPEADDNGDPVNLRTGLFVHVAHDLGVKEITRLSVVRVYRQNSSVLGLFGIGTSSPYDMYIWTPDPTSYTSLVLVLANGGQVAYPRVSGSSLENGVFQHTGSPSLYYYSTIRLIDVGTGHPDFVLTLKDGRKYVFHHHGGKLDSFTDRNGNKTTINRNGESGPITSIVGPTGRTLSFTANPDGTISQISDALGRTYAYTYLNHYLQTVTDPEGGVWRYTYDANNRMRTVQDPVGNIRVTNDYDANGRVSKQTYADTSTMQFAYTLDGNGKVAQTDVTDQRGNIRRVAFNSMGYVTSSIYPLGQPEQQTTTFARDLNSGFITSKLDALNRTTTLTYDVRGNILSVTRLYGTPDAVKTLYTYEPQFNQLASTTDPLGHTWRNTYDASGNQVTATDPLGNTSTAAYNGVGQIIKVSDALGNATQLNYDGGDLTGSTDPLGRVTSITYDVVGRPTVIVRPMGDTRQIAYDRLDRVKQVTDSLNGRTNLTYDANGNLLAYSDQLGNPVSYTYNNLSKRATRTDSLLHSDTKLYDVAGKLLRFTDRKGQVSGASYDNMNRLIQMGFGATTGNPTAFDSTLNYTYDNANRVRQLVNQVGATTSGQIIRTYDGLDRITQEQTPQATLSYTYDAADRRATMAVSGQPVTQYTFDDANRLKQIQSGVGTVSFAYDPANRKIAATLPNGVTINYTYDNASQLTGITYKNGATIVGDLAYAYDAEGRRISVGGSLSQVVVPQAVASVVYNANNQLTQWNGATFSYDLNGNLSSDGSTSYTWNSRDQLIALSGAAPASFDYDAAGRRTSKTINGANTGFVYDGLNFVQELTNGTPKANLLTGLGLDQLYARAVPSIGGTSSFLVDALGTIVAEADSSASIQVVHTYEPYGKPATALAPGANTQRFTGREDDAGTGLYFYRARYYAPSTGRFIAEDPIDSLGTIDPYAYVRDNPVNYVDPEGRWWQIIVPIGVGAGAWAIFYAVKTCMEDCTGCTYPNLSGCPCPPAQMAMCDKRCTIGFALAEFAIEPFAALAEEIGKEIGKRIADGRVHVD